MSYSVLIPKIQTAIISPNPVDFNTKFLLSVLVSEETIMVEPYYYYSADLYAGEV